MKNYEAYKAKFTCDPTRTYPKYYLDCHMDMHEDNT